MEQILLLTEQWKTGEIPTLNALEAALCGCCEGERAKYIAFRLGFWVVRTHLLTPDAGFRELERIYGRRMELRNLDPEPVLADELPLWCRDLPPQAYRDIFG